MFGQRFAFKIGAVFYGLWGFQHVVFGGTFLVALSDGGIPSVLELSDVASTIPEHDFPGLLNGMLAWHSLNIVLFGTFALIVGIGMFRHSSRRGYWMNLIAVGAFELGFVFVILIPGYIGLSAAISGPVLLALAVTFSTWGLRISASQTA